MCFDAQLLVDQLVVSDLFHHAVRLESEGGKLWSQSS